MPVPAAISRTRVGAVASPPSDVVGEFGKEYRAKPVIVKDGNAAGKVDGSVVHDASFCRGLNRTRLLQQPT